MTMTVKRRFHVDRRRRGAKQLNDGEAAEMPPGRVPRVARLMAVALRCQRLVESGTTQAELAQFGHITPARMSQIMLLLNLAPDIQEQVLFLPNTVHGRDAIQEIDVRPIAQTADWRQQRRAWVAVQGRR